MADRRRLGRLAVVGIAVAASLVALKVFSGDDPPDPCRPPAAAPPAETALMPAGLSFDRVGTVTHVRKAEGHITVQAVAAKPLDEVTVLIQDAVTAAGYRAGGMDNEGDEAEVFFTSGSIAAGQAVVKRAECEGRWDIDLTLVDPAAVPTSTPLPTTT
jgi:hypothetical protein